MKHTIALLILLSLLFVLPGSTRAVAPPAMAGAETGYDLSWWTVDGGGCTSVTSGVYTLSATAGQPDAGTTSHSPYALLGGFWDGTVGGATTGTRVFLPVVLRSR